MPLTDLPHVHCMALSWLKVQALPVLLFETPFLTSFRSWGASSLGSTCSLSIFLIPPNYALEFHLAPLIVAGTPTDVRWIRSEDDPTTFGVMQQDANARRDITVVNSQGMENGSVTILIDVIGPAEVSLVTDSSVMDNPILLTDVQRLDVQEAGHAPISPTPTTTTTSSIPIHTSAISNSTSSTAFSNSEYPPPTVNTSTATEFIDSSSLTAAASNPPYPDTSSVETDTPLSTETVRPSSSAFLPSPASSPLSSTPSPNPSGAGGTSSDKKHAIIALAALSSALVLAAILYFTFQRRRRKQALQKFRKLRQVMWKDYVDDDPPRTRPVVDFSAELGDDVDREELRARYEQAKAEEDEIDSVRDWVSRYRMALLGRDRAQDRLSRTREMRTRELPTVLAPPPQLQASSTPSRFLDNTSER